jgi:hypothetical protein
MLRLAWRPAVALGRTIIARLAAAVAVQFQQPGGYDAGTGGRHASCLQAAWWCGALSGKPGLMPGPLRH